MSKPNQLRKKALEYAKKREWDKALNEYIRLAEIEEHNPNVFNELGDLHLKMGNKAEAFKAFHSAIDAYAQMSLYNNAVAVCKKIIRLNAADRLVYGKLAKLRNEQGFKKEAVTYAVSFMEKITKDDVIKPQDVKDELTQLATEMTHSPDVLERIAEYLQTGGFQEEAGVVLEHLANAYADQGMQVEMQQAIEKMAATGHVAAEGSPASGEAVPTTGDEDLSGIPEIPEVDMGLPSSDAVSPFPETPSSSLPGADGAFDFDTVDMGTNPAADSTTSATQTSTEEFGGFDEQVSPLPPTPDPPTPPTPDPPPSPVDPVPPPPSTADPPPVADEYPPTSAATEEQYEPLSPTDTPSAPPPLADDEIWVPKEELPDGLVNSGDGAGEVVQLADIVDQFSAEVSANVDADDYRSHYDLGMAYLEMELIPEAIREFQFASQSSNYQVRSLELIGLCFIKQNQPRLAIKQLERGLSLVGDVDRNTIGLQYNLGLAYEMMGESEKAKTCFEDVYMLDVAFRDVAEKIKQYT